MKPVDRNSRRELPAYVLDERDVVHARALRLHRVRHEEVVDLLRMLLVDIRIALRGRDAHDVVDVGEQPVEGREDAARLQELVHVAAHDDVRAGVECEERGDESLRGVLRVRRMTG